MFSFFKKPIEQVKPVKPVEPISKAEQELLDIKEMVKNTYDPKTFMFFVDLAKSEGFDIDKHLKSINADTDYVYVWYSFVEPLLNWCRIYETSRLDVASKDEIFTHFAIACKKRAAENIEEIRKKCRERYEAHWTKVEIQSMFNNVARNEEVLAVLKLKETYGQEVFWSQIFSDHKPFDANDWLEDGESL